MKIKDRISVAIPDSSLSDEKGLREKTLKIGKFARAFSIFGVEKIVIYKPILLRDLKNKVHTVLAESDDEDKQLVIR